MAPAEASRPAGSVGYPLYAAEARRVRSHVLHESQLASWPQHTVHLPQHRSGIADRAQHQRGDDRIKLLVTGRQVLGDSVGHRDLGHRQACALFGQCPQVGLRLDGEDGRHGGGVMPEI